MTLVWAGSYTDTMGGYSRGISALRLTDRGLQYLGLAAVTGSPSFLVISESTGLLYAVDEGNGRVEAFSRTGKNAALVALGGQPTSGLLTCHLSVTAEWLYACNYGSGTVDVFPLDEEGRIRPLVHTLSPGSDARGPLLEQDGPHTHSTLAFGDTVIVADLGTDRVYLYRWHGQDLDLESAIEFPPGTGPRDFVVSPVAGKIFLSGELGGNLFTLGGGRNLQIVRSGSTGAAPGDHGAGLAVDPTGRFLYTGLRGSDRVVVIDSNTLQPIADVPSGGEWPRNLCIVGNTLLVANQKSGTVTTFRLDPRTGVPTPDGPGLFVDSPTYLLPDLA